MSNQFHFCYSSYWITYLVSWKFSSGSFIIGFARFRRYLSRHCCEAALFGVLLGQRRNSKNPLWFAVSSTLIVNEDPVLYFRTIIPWAYFPPASCGRGCNMNYFSQMMFLENERFILRQTLVYYAEKACWVFREKGSLSNGSYYTKSIFYTKFCDKMKPKPVS